MGNQGKSGCGCLVFILVICMVLVGVLIHPFSLRLMAKQMRYEDKIVPSDSVFVPRFVEDRNGELYTEAFREYWAGNCKAIYVEEDRIFGIGIADLVAKMAQTKGIKENIVKPVSAEGEEDARLTTIKEKFQAMGVKKVIILVPEYASRRFHDIFDSSRGQAKTLFMIKPVEVSYFKKDRWWKDGTSRIVFVKEVYELGSYYFSGFKTGQKRKIDQ
ncbi:MAG TPA: hypothetical protein VMT62_17885 [Syntrophorhabdaceae bacterium]|nr:hypothetical protein [Syntrophorhabdaceae bacterium]